MEIQASQASAHQSSTVSSASTTSQQHRHSLDQRSAATSYRAEREQVFTTPSESSATYTLLRNGANTAIQTGVLRVNESLNSTQQQSRIIEQKSNPALATFLSVSENSDDPRIIDTYV